MTAKQAADMIARCLRRIPTYVAVGVPEREALTLALYGETHPIPSWLPADDDDPQA